LFGIGLKPVWKLVWYWFETGLEMVWKLVWNWFKTDLKWFIGIFLALAYTRRQLLYLTRR